MPQAQLPLFPEGVTPITSDVAFERREGKVYYFNGHLPVFVHDREDLASFRLFSSQLVINGNATQAQICRAFGVPLVTVKRYVKLYRLGGPRAFFTPPARRKGRRLTPEVCERAQALLNEGFQVPELAQELGILASTLHKAIRSGRLKAGIKKKARVAKSKKSRAPKANEV